MPTYSEIYEKAYAKKCDRCCPDCESSNSLSYADDEVLVCSFCGYSIEADELQSAWIDKISADYDYTY